MIEKDEVPQEPAQPEPAPVVIADRAHAAVAKAFQLGINRGAPVMISAQAGDMVALPDGHQLHTINEQLLPKPRRLEQVIDLLTPADLVAYTNRFKSENSLLFIAATPEEGKVCAVAELDYHAPGEGGQSWCEHKARLLFRTSWQFKALKALDGLLSQDKFALALKEIAPFCASMAAADLLELAQTLALTSKGEYRTADDEFSGSVDFVYNVQVSASAGTSASRKLQVPQQIAFNIPLLLDGKPQTVVCDFRYRIPGNPQEKVHMGLKIVREKEMNQALAESVRSTLVEGTNLPAFLTA